MRRELERDNRGIALISVMVGVMLCLLLSATIMRVSYLSFLQKSIGEKTTTTFYENEMFVDDLKLGIQKVVAQAAVGVSTTSSDATQDFILAMKTGLGTGSVTTLNARLQSFLKEDDTIYDVKVSVEGEVIGGIKKYVVEENGDLIIKNVLITYKTKPSGYLSKVNTDIRIRSPFYNVEAISSSGGYSMFAGGGFTINPNSTVKPNILHMSGDIYIGYDKSDSRKNEVNTKKGTQNYTLLTNAMATEWKKYVCIEWEAGSNVTINGDVYISGYSKLLIMSGNVDVRGKIYVSNTSQVIISTSAKLTCQDIILGCSENYTGGDSIADGYDSTSVGAKDYTTLPKACESPTKADWWYDTGANRIYDGLYIWNGSKAERIYKVTTEREEVKAKVTKYDSSGAVVYAGDGSRAKEEVDYKVQRVKSLKVTSSSRNNTTLDCLVVDVMNFPDRMITKKIDGVNYDFDVEFVKLVDVEYYIRGTKNSPYIDNATRVTNYPKTPNTETKWGAPYTTSTDIQGSGRKLNFKKKDGSTIEVKTMVGAIETGNNGSHFLMPSYGTNIVFNDQNNNMNSFGVYISPNKIEGTAKEMNSYISSLLSLVEDNYDNAKKFFDALGQRTLPGSAAEQYRVINNMFNGGIKVFYESNSGGGGGGTVSTDVTRNSTVEAVTLENWSKSYVEENPS
ncbi:MAG: hypothetical protein J5531_05295 [Lachnospiraceae bacterium]|nr:hypothetical protein [Lachnospiraceae bacterium]